MNRDKSAIFRDHTLLPLRSRIPIREIVSFIIYSVEQQNMFD